MEKQLPEKPLYCFRVDKENGKITMFTITDYTINIMNYTHRKEFVFDARLAGAKVRTWYHLKERNLDNLINYKYFSFDNDAKKATKHIQDIIKKQCLELAKERDKMTNFLSLVYQNN